MFFRQKFAEFQLDQMISGFLLAGTWLTNLVIWREEELVEHLSLPVRPGPVTEVGRLLAGDVQAPAGGSRLDKVPAGSCEQLCVLWNQAGLVLVVVQPHLEVQV